MKPAIATVDTANKAAKPTLDPNATRYGITLIWDINTNSRDFATWKINANQVFPFRPFIGEICTDHRGTELFRNTRMPEQQITDLATVSQYFVELTELAKLDEEKAAAVASILSNPKSCSKYAIELENECNTCWLDYLYNEAPDRIKSVFKDEAALQRAANRSVEQLKAALSKALDEARRLLDHAVRDVDDPKHGKSAFVEQDYLNVYHTHADRPKYKTSTSNTDSIQALAEVLKGSFQKEAAPTVDAEAIAKLVAEAVAKETAELKAKLAAYEAPAEKKTAKEKKADESES